MEVLFKNRNIFYNLLCFFPTLYEKILFARNDARFYLRTVFHVFTTVHNMYVAYFALTMELDNHEEDDLQTLSRFRAGFFTAWNFCFQTVFLTISLIYDVLEWLDRHETNIARKLKYYRDVLFCGLVLPLTLRYGKVTALKPDVKQSPAQLQCRLSRDVVVLDGHHNHAILMLLDIHWLTPERNAETSHYDGIFTCPFISSMFWTVFLIDRELVFPEIYDKIVPWWFNHCVHTNITIVVLLETLIQARRHPTDLKAEVILNGAIGVLYAIVYYSIYFFAHRWLYGVFGIMTWWQVCLYQILIWGSCYVFYFIQFPINRLFHREDDASTQEAEVKEQKNGVSELKTVIPEMKFNGEEKPPNENGKESFSNKSLSLKYRSKSQFENSSL